MALRSTLIYILRTIASLIKSGFQVFLVVLVYLLVKARWCFFACLCGSAASLLNSGAAFLSSLGTSADGDNLGTTTRAATGTNPSMVNNLGWALVALTTHLFSSGLGRRRRRGKASGY